VTRYIQPGLELIALDPKRSASIIGREAFDSDVTLREWRYAPRRTSASRTRRLRVRARDLGAERHRCRGPRPDQPARRSHLSALLALPEHVSTKPGARSGSVRSPAGVAPWRRGVVPGHRRNDSEGAIIVSQSTSRSTTHRCCRAGSRTSSRGSHRAGDAASTHTRRPSASTREPEASAARHDAPVRRARLTSLGYACHVATRCRRTAIEPSGACASGIVDETCDPAVFPPMWRSLDAPVT